MLDTMLSDNWHTYIVTAVLPAWQDDCLLVTGKKLIYSLPNHEFAIGLENDKSVEEGYIFIL